jgi:hypothetical protein
VTILEGRDRIGGRVHQEQLPNGLKADLGPNWIHGTINNPIYDIAKETKTIVGDWDTRSYMCDPEGNLMALEDSESYASIMWDIVTSAFKHSNRHCAKIDPTLSLWDYFKEQVVMRIPESEADFVMKRSMVLHVAESWGAFVGSPIRRQSLKFFWLEECIEGGMSVLLESG